MTNEEIVFTTDDNENDTDGEPTTRTIEDVQAEPKRRRGRPRKNPTEEPASDVPKTPKPRVSRSKKLTGADVADGVEMLTTVIVMAGGEEYAHWHIPASEFRPVADGWADLMNRIPTRYVKGAFDAAGYLSLAIGTYSIVSPRIALSRAIKLAKRRERQEQEEQVITTWQ